MILGPEDTSAIPFPPHRYVPGKTPRHPEDWFDPIKSEVPADPKPAGLRYTRPWLAGLAYFDAGFYWECHEVLEAVWLLTPQGTPEREMTQAIIQLANARLKLHMGKPRATLRLCEMVRGHLHNCPADRPVMGLLATDIAVLVRQAEDEQNLK